MVDPIFLRRWSPRSFLPDPVDPEELSALFEAARWAPSSNNEQPWVFVYAVSADDRARFAEGLLEFNRAWASNAPVLAYLLARRRSGDGTVGSPTNGSARFDAGAAWMSLALQAERLGLSVHAMGGIDREKVAQLVGVEPADYEVLIGIAIGHRGDPDRLPTFLRAREGPSGRRPLSEVAVEGRLTSPSGGR